MHVSTPHIHLLFFAMFQILQMAVLSILLTAPLGAGLIALSGPILLNRSRTLIQSNYQLCDRTGRSLQDFLCVESRCTGNDDVTNTSKKDVTFNDISNNYNDVKKMTSLIFN